MNEEMTWKYLRQVEHIRGHLWHIYSITVMVATTKLSKWWLQLHEFLLAQFLCNPLINEIGLKRNKSYRVPYYSNTNDIYVLIYYFLWIFIAIWNFQVW